MKKILSILSVIILFHLITVSCDDEAVDQNTPKTFYEMASTESDLTLLKAAIDRAGFQSVLMQTDSRTLFAPTNDAFKSYLKANSLKNIQEISVSNLQTVLSYHLVNGKIASSSIVNNSTIQTVGGSSFTITTNGGVMIMDNANEIAKVIKADVQATNGVIHKIDKVLKP